LAPFIPVMKRRSSATPFDTPQKMTALIDWTTRSLAAKEFVDHSCFYRALPGHLPPFWTVTADSYKPENSND
jgi:hypothetical protein